jgi:hypothetical protein
VSKSSTRRKGVIQLADLGQSSTKVSLGGVVDLIASFFEVPREVLGT